MILIRHNYLASVESESDHLLAKAVIEYVKNPKYYPVGNTDVIKGKGIVADVDGHRVAVGNLALMEYEKVNLNKEMRDDISRFEQNGDSLV
jgi:Cd2+/Zn2+-exporting ATPase